MMVLVEQVAAQPRTKVTLGQMRRQLAGQILTLGRQPTGQTVARVVPLDDQVLNDEVPITLEPCALRDATLGPDDLLIMDDQLRLLAALVRAETAGILLSRLAITLLWVGLLSILLGLNCGLPRPIEKLPTRSLRTR
jgi:hypothetical protein